MKLDAIDSNELNSEKELPLKFVVRVIKHFHLLVPALITLANSVWIFFISKFYINNGRLPIYGDPEIVSFNGLDRNLVAYSLGVMIYGTFIWIIITSINFFVRKNVVSKIALVFGIIVISISLILILSPQSTWLLD